MQVPEMGSDHVVHNEQHDAGVLWGCVSFRVVESRSVEMLWSSSQKKSSNIHIQMYCLYRYILPIYIFMY